MTSQHFQDWKDLLTYRLGEPGSANRMKELLALGVDPNLRTHTGTTPLGAVLNLGSSPSSSRCLSWLDMTHMLLTAGADPNLPCGQGHTPLSQAACLPSPAGIRALLDAGAELSRPSPTRDPVHMAVKARHLDTLLALIAAGATLDCPDRDGELPLTRALETGKSGQWALAFALLEGGAPTQASGPLHRSAMVMACQNPALDIKQTEFIQRLIAKKADINTPDILGRTALVYLVSQFVSDTPASLALVKIMLRAGADPRIPDKQGRNILESCSKVPPMMASLLRQAMVNLDVAQMEQQTVVPSLVRSGPRL